MKKVSLKVIIVFSIGVLTWSGSIIRLSGEDNSHQMQAARIEKSQILKSKSVHEHDHSGATFKNQGPLRLQLTRELFDESSGPSNEKIFAHLILTIEASEDLPSPVQLQWSVPQGMSITENPLGEIFSMHKGEILTYKVRVETSEHVDIVAPVRVIAIGGDHRYGFSAETSYDLHRQEELDRAAERLKKRASTHMKSHLGLEAGSKKFNIFQ